MKPNSLIRTFAELEIYTLVTKLLQRWVSCYRGGSAATEVGQLLQRYRSAATEVGQLLQRWVSCYRGRSAATEVGQLLQR